MWVAATAPVVALMTVLAAGCGGAEDVAGQRSLGPSPTNTRNSATPSTSPAQPPDPDQEDRMRLQITIGGRSFDATLTDSAAAADLIAQLPLTVEMVDHGGVEKTGPLPSPLSLDGQPEGADPDVGDVGYYAPGHDLVLYYGDQSYYPGIVVLGRLNGDAAQQLSALTGPVTATVVTP